MPAVDRGPIFTDRSLIQDKAFVNGKWVSAISGKVFDVEDPATGAVIAQIPEQASQDVQEAIEAASAAQQSFQRTVPSERAKMLKNWAQLMRDNQEDLARLVTWENGKTLSEARGEILYAASFLEWFAGEAVRLYGDFIQTEVASNRTVTMKAPVGVCGFITPWNFPAAMVTRKVGPAIAAGCTVILKAPCETPLTALALAELSVRANLPPGVFNVVTASENTVELGQVITSSRVIRKLSFTGSTQVGKSLMLQSASTLKKLSMELGGLAPFIVFEDANIDDAVNGAIASKFRQTGQTCVCANMLLVHKSVYEQFATKLLARMDAFKVGNGFTEDSTHGPLIHSRAVEKVKLHIEDARQKGGNILTAGKFDSTLGPNFVQPTVVLQASTDMLFTQEETFGPLAGLIPFETEDDAIEIANRSDVGLAGYFYSENIRRCWRVAERLDVGMVGINTGIVSNPATPFGGVKQSGFGREGSKYGIDEYVTVKSLNFGGI